MVEAKEIPTAYTEEILPKAARALKEALAQTPFFPHLALEDGALRVEVHHPALGAVLRTRYIPFDFALEGKDPEKGLLEALRGLGQYLAQERPEVRQVDGRPVIFFGDRFVDLGPGKAVPPSALVLFDLLGEEEQRELLAHLEAALVG